ncbi:EXD1 [Bugula neritina]|uniref:EXD1 n=1 Tax=Bugula neritina TaxID=10212 RepID=A0A7J7KQI7_BUGNE|nr:EXD1 [Bugula neritina]
MELVDQEHQLPDVIQLLRKETQLSVDCEGVDLGRFGELCLVQVATTQKVYLFDVEVLGRKIFDQGLRNVLEDARITKLFFDCREDCNILQHGYDVKVQGCGFSGAAKEFMHKAFDSDKELWKKRPLKVEYMLYAATGEYKQGSPYIRNARLPERIIPEVTRRGGTRSIEKFPSTGELCISCNWRTETPHSGQCHRCYLIDHPEASKTAYPTHLSTRRAIFDDDYFDF